MMSDLGVWRVGSLFKEGRRGKLREEDRRVHKRRIRCIFWMTGCGKVGYSMT